MKYYLTRATFGATDLEIDENEYEDYKESSKVLSNCLSLEESYEILISNYIDLENEQLAWATLSMVRNVSDDDFFNVTLSLDRRMVNFLATARLHIEHLQKRGGDCMRGQAVEEVKADIKSFCDAEADKPEYKFMWDLRNEVLHSSLATHWFSFSTSRANSFDDPIPKLAFSLKFGSLKSSFTAGFKPGELDTISSDDQIDLVSLTRVYMESLSTIQVKFREYVAESVNQARSKMEEAFCRYREVCEDSLIYLELWKVGDLDKDKIIEESAFSLFYDDQRVQLQDKNRELVNLRNSHVTGKQAEKEQTSMTAQERPVVFVSLTGDEAIKLYDLDPQSGALELRATSPAHGPSGALFLHPSRPVLYDAHVMSTTLASFRLDTASGELTLINKVDTGIDIPAHLITDRAGRFLLTAYYGGGGVTVHRLGDDGAIGDLVQRIDTGPRGHAVLLTEDERFVFVPHVCPNNKTSQFRFDASTGQLSPNDPSVLAPPAGDPGPRHICFRPLGDVAYIVNEQANTLTAHRFDSAGGTLSIFQDISTLPADYAEGGNTAHVEIHPNGQWCYASNRGHDSIVGYNIDAEGALSPFGHYPVPASPRSFNIDPTGTYLYCAGEAADRMTCYQVDATSGALQPIADYEVGSKPFWVMVTTL